MGQKVSTAASRPRAPRGGRERVPLSSPAVLLVPPLGAPSVNHGQLCPCLRLFFWDVSLIVVREKPCWAPRFPL